MNDNADDGFVHILPRRMPSLAIDSGRFSPGD